MEFSFLLKHQINQNNDFLNDEHVLNQHQQLKIFFQLIFYNHY